ncbi:MAG: glycosyltransferase [Bacteroidota bacterium]
MKICFFGDGESIHIQRWCEHFVAKGHEVHLISFKNTTSSSYTVHFIDAGKISVAGGNSKILLQKSKVKKVLRKIQPDILHSLYATSYGVAGAMAGFHPYVVTALGSDILISPKKSFLYKKMLRYVFRKADWITVMSPQMKEEFINMKLGDENKVEILPFGINTTVFHNQNRKLPSNSFVITSTRNFEEVYNIPHILYSVEAVKNHIPGLKLNLVGDGTKRNEIEKLVDKLKLRDIATFTGRISQPEMSSVLQSSHLFLSVSLSDGNNISLNEAMACGAYCIATDIPANRQWIEDGKNGILTGVNNIPQLSEKIMEAYKNYSSLAEKAEKINTLVIAEKADWNKNMQRVENKYIELCRKK